MRLLDKIHNFLRGNKGVGEVPTKEPLQEGHELRLEDEIPTNEEVQDTFNADNLDVLVEDGDVENVCNETE